MTEARKDPQAEDPASAAFIEESKNRAKTARAMINHCLDQLGDDDVWWAPAKGCNSIGIIAQHLIGNLRQWIVSGVGGAPDTRDRPREFRVERKTPKSGLQGELNGLLDQVVDTYSSLPPSELLQTRTIQGLNRSVLSAIYGTMAHLQLHTGQILYLTHLRLGEAYAEFPHPALTPSPRSPGSTNETTPRA